MQGRSRRKEKGVATRALKREEEERERRGEGKRGEGRVGLFNLHVRTPTQNLMCFHVQKP